MSSADAAEFSCRIYERRPAACRAYPWADAQVLFPECVFVEDGQVVDFETAVRHLGSGAVVEAACQRCGRCCYAWRRERDVLTPVIRCSHLVRRVRPGAGPPEPDHEHMAAVRDVRPFD